MRRLRWLVIGNLCAVVLLGAPHAAACGDKFLVDNSGQAIPRLQPNLKLAKIAIYRDADVDREARGWSTNYEEVLDAVGHEVWVITTPEALAEELRSGTLDLVITDVERAQSVKPMTEKSTATTVLPFLQLPSRGEIKAAKEQFGQVLKVPTNASGIITVVARTLATR